jgi:type IV secretion system protein VirB10
MPEQEDQDLAQEQDEQEEEDLQQEPVYENVSELTKNEGPPSFNRGKVLKIACISIASIIVLAFVFNSVRENKRKNKTNVSNAGNVSVPDFLERERDNAARPDTAAATGDDLPPVSPAASDLPAVEPIRPASEPASGGVPGSVVYETYPPPPATQQSSGGGGGGNIRPEHSPLIPAIEGSLFSSGFQDMQGYPPPIDSYDSYIKSLEAQRDAALAGQNTGYYIQQQQPSYQTQNMQDDKKNFYNGPDNAMTARNGYYLGDNVIWTGSIIPGVLVTGINTDLPGDVVARITSNVYDSRTGRNLLLPQGTILVARYNSSISYAQSRVQIVWDHLIRPDGYLFNLEGMNGVDARGISGQAGAYHENWFQYLKAAGIIAMYTLANAKLTEVAGVKLSEDAAQANAQLTAQLGSNIISRALDIQPTITVSGGEKINIMLNKPIFLPPVDDYPVTEKYTRR